MIHKAYKEYSYSKRDLNPHSRNGQRILSPSCLPFHHSSILKREKRAENETRTRDPNLGKVMLYQLSYFRKPLIWCPEQDSNLHASRHTHLKRARLPIPPPGPFFSTLKKRPHTASVTDWSGRRDSNPRP